MKKGATVADVEARNQQIIRQAVRRRPHSLIAAEFNVTPRTVALVMEAYRKTRPQLTKQDPTTIIEDMIAEYQAAMDELGEIAYQSTQDAVKVGAIRQRLTAMRDMRELMQETGTLPCDLGQLKVQLELSVIAERFIAVLDQHDASPEMVASLMQALRPDLRQLHESSDDDDEDDEDDLVDADVIEDDGET